MVSTKKIAAGLLLGTALVGADVVVEDFTNWVGQNKFGGLWLADSDVYGGGTSTVTEPTAGQDIVKASSNVLMTWDDANMAIVSKIKVSANISAEKPWAYGGWVMDFKAADTAGAGPEPWNRPLWERKNEVDISKCTALEMTLQFTANKQLWIEIYNPHQEKNTPLAPQWGWRFYDATGAKVTKRFNLSGLGKAVTKWTDPANTVPLDLNRVSRIKILYEGQEGGAVAVPAPFDQVEHTLTIFGVKLLGDACAVNANPGGLGVLPGRGIDRSGITVASAPGMLTFGNLPSTGDVSVEIRNLAGKVVAGGRVSGSAPVLSVPRLETGVYAVKAAGAGISRNFSVTLLN